ncbi:glycosyltransferase [Echinicola marina]|uniref:glycosyltransferase n=1 Tax=Echinicola marina TaxID=2859768 RepID=UPI001CF6635C|nr:glycosyltransferase [Echinicola marina]UCS91994.1 glycosyltransferase [Echinicola marina]
MVVLDKKCLIIPSWYPTLNNPLKGSFFREQAAFLSHHKDIDIKVLYGLKQSTPLLKLLWIYFLSFIKSNLEIDRQFLPQNPIAYGFIIPDNRRVPDRFRIQLARYFYRKAYDSYVKINGIPDLIHAQSGMDASIYAHELSKINNIPFVIIEHQVFVFHYYSRLRAKLILDAFKAATKIATVSYDERRQVLMNQPECNPEVIWNLVDETKYEIDLSRRNRKFTIITILNSLPIKGAITFLEAIKEVVKMNHDVEFIMIGKGGDLDSKNAEHNMFITKSKELGIYEKGTFLPFVERSKISDVLNRAHVFVSPTIQEPHGIAVREAMMCGLPVVTTANGGVEDSITHETGLVVPVKNPQSLAEAIIKIKNKEVLINPQKIRNLAVFQCGRETFFKSMKSFYQVD